MDKRTNERPYCSTQSGARGSGSSGTPGTTPADEERSSCFCFESDDDSTEKIRLKYTKR